MLRPPTEYESTRVELSNRVAKVENLFFDNAIIFFTPKVANKGVDLASLQCTIVQITDRGEWGKEEEAFTVDASSVSNRRYRNFDLTTDAEYSLKILPPPELRMGILEIYFDPTNLTNSSRMANSTNPSSPIDMTAITAAITDGTAQEVAAIQQLQAASNTKIREVVEFEYKANPWTNDPTQHVAVTPDTATQAIVFTNIGTESVAWDLFFDTALKTSTPQFDNIMPPGGSVRVSAEESSAGILLYTLTGSASMVLVNVQK